MIVRMDAGFPEPGLLWSREACPFTRIRKNEVLSEALLGRGDLCSMS